MPDCPRLQSLLPVPLPANPMERSLLVMLRQFFRGLAVDADGVHRSAFASRFFTQCRELSALSEHKPKEL